MPVNEMWRNEPDRIKFARIEARKTHATGNYVSAHSIMLSAYITALGGKPVEGRHTVKFFLLALWHAICMFRYRSELNHNQLDVLVQFLLKLRAKLPLVRKTFEPGKKRRFAWNRQIDGILFDLARREVELAKVHGKPHQLALAYMTWAEADCAATDNTEAVIEYVRLALDLEQQIRAEEQSMGLRQFVRILRKAGELFGNPELSHNRHCRVFSQIYLKQALKLAQGEADCPDQVPKIQAAIRKF